MNSLSPSEIIKFRTECYRASDGKGVFSLYSVKSDLRKIFREKEFVEHFRLLTKNSEHAGVKIVTETIKKKLAEVKYIEHISENGEIITFFSKTVLTIEEGAWRILKEQREKKKQ
ncbi:MAG: hypothetical protein C0602_07610 [Denitrovibrio sp.]|nr:MAG: hypothetical protein C0602_07610 [Denitrovibrio sp.]